MLLVAALAVGLTACVGSVTDQTDAVAADLAGLPGVADVESSASEPSLETGGYSRITVVLAADVTADQLGTVVERWHEWAPQVSAAVHLDVDLGDRAGIRIDPFVDLDVAVEESVAWLKVARIVDGVALDIYPGSADTTWSQWGVSLGPASGIVAEIAEIRPELERHGHLWSFTTTDAAGAIVELQASVQLPPPEALSVLEQLAALDEPAVGPRTISASWRAIDGVQTLDIELSLEPPDMTTIPSNELPENIPGSAAEAYGFRLRDTLPTPGVPTRIAVRVFDSEDFLTLVLP